MQASQRCSFSCSSRVSGAFLRDREQPGDAILVLPVQLELRRAHRHEVVVVDPLGQLGLDLILAAAQQEGTDASLQLVEVAVADGAAALVELVEGRG